jgi:hypothetical protein
MNGISNLKSEDSNPTFATMSGKIIEFFVLVFQRKSEAI